MNSDFEREALALLQEVLALPEESRQAFLESRCSGQPQLRQRVGALVGAAPDSGSFPMFQLGEGEELSDATPALKTAKTHPGSASRIGPYRLIEQLGEGGMGTVYLAEQAAPVQRRVALKVVKLGMDSKQVLARFEVERQALAAMSHPAIAKVFDAGITESGQPYFVMELVEGTTLCDYCDQHRLSLPQRMKLFQQICEGVQHAHQKGVIHRDLKPSNVLVVTEGKEPVPKIVDFGLAKGVGRDFIEVTDLTENHQILGTFEYMSPEQASAGTEVVDARADIYSLGVILYELLSGELPFPTEVLRKAGQLEALRLIRDQDPSKPSIQSARPGSEIVAAQRQTSARTLRRALQGDLDWIVLKAMAKEPERRYAAATVLAEDLQRYLEFQPVLAGPPSAVYRLKKLMRRYRIQVMAACAVLATAVAGAVVAINFAFDAEDRAAAETAARRTIQSNSYVANVEMAAAWVELQRTDRAQQRLEACPQHLRQWEWWWLDANSNNCLAELRGRTGALHSASFSPDGTRIITKSHNGYAVAWDAATGVNVAEIGKHTGRVGSAVFSPNSRRIATITKDLTAQVRNSSTGAIVAELGGGPGVTSSAFSPDGKRVVTVSGDRALVWDATTGVVVVTVGLHHSRVKPVRLDDAQVLFQSGTRPNRFESAWFSLDGTKIIARIDWEDVGIWDATTGVLVAKLGGLGLGSHKLICISSNGNRVVTTPPRYLGRRRDTIQIWDVAAGATIASFAGHSDVVTSVSFSPDSKQIVSTSADTTAQVWNVATGAIVTVLKGHTGTILSAAFSPDGKQVVTASADATARVWDIATGAVVAVLKGHTGAVSSASFSPDSRRIVTTSTDSTTRVWDAATGAHGAERWARISGVRSASFSPDGARLVASCDGQTALVWNATTGTVIARLRGRNGTVKSASFSPDGMRIVTTSTDATACVWDAATGNVAMELRGHTGALMSASFSPDGTRIVTASTDSTARVWDAATGATITEFRGHSAGVRSASFSIEGARVVTASDDENVVVWNASTGSVLAQVKGVNGVLFSAAFSPDGTQFVTTSFNRPARVWDAMTGEFVAELKGLHRKSAAFSPDGTRILTTSDDKIAVVWNAATGQVVAKLRGHTGVIRSASFNPDGTRIVTGSADGTARVWDAETGAGVAELRGLAVRSALFSPDGSQVVTVFDDNTVRLWDALRPRIAFAEQQQRQQGQPWAHLRTTFVREMLGKSPPTWLSDQTLPTNRPNFIK